MENQQKDKDENLFERDTTNDFSSGPLAAVSEDGDEDEAEEESAADDELDEDL